jgi:hypothetical protein
MKRLEFHATDHGRPATAKRDSFLRALAIASGSSYKAMRLTLRGMLGFDCAGVEPSAPTAHAVLENLNFSRASGSQAHHDGLQHTLTADAESLPTKGAHILQFNHNAFTVLVDGVIHDLEDPTRNGKRFVMNLWSAPAPNQQAVAIFERVLAAMQDAEEMGGPEGQAYISLMGRIEREARQRRLFVTQSFIEEN